MARGVKEGRPSSSGDLMKTSATQSSPSFIPSRQAHLDGQIVEVTARAPGRIERVVVAEDQLTGVGDLLAELDHREMDRRVAATSALLEQAMLAAMGGAKPRGLSEAHQLRQKAMLSRIELPALPRGLRDDYLKARLERSSAEVRATVAGRVVAVRVQPREAVALAQPLFSILEHDDVWVLASFARTDFPRLREGQAAKVIASGHTCDARVTGITGAGTPVLLEFVQPRPPSLRPGAPARVLVVPE
jgi:multidrug resistance efflux pump